MTNQTLSPGGVDWLPPLILLRVYLVIHGGQVTGGVIVLTGHVLRRLDLIGMFIMPSSGR